MTFREDVAQLPSVGVGQTHVTVPGGKVSMLVGSCVGLFIHHRDLRIAVASHILLPQSRGVVAGNDGFSSGRYADTAIESSLHLIQSRLDAQAGRSQLDDGTAVPFVSKIFAHVVGGADMFDHRYPVPIGTKNSEAVFRLLKQVGIPLSSSDVGGYRARRVIFDAENGTMRTVHYEAIPSSREILDGGNDSNLDRNADGKAGDRADRDEEHDSDRDLNVAPESDR